MVHIVSVADCFQIDDDKLASSDVQKERLKGRSFTFSKFDALIVVGNHDLLLTSYKHC